MRKLYSIREITQMLNAELQSNSIDYRYTEERVRARLRYLRSKATTEAESLHVEPKIYGYDKRAKYYTEEDVNRLRAIWVGPMLAEFTEHHEDLNIIDSDKEEVEVREAKASDIEPIAKLNPLITAELDIITQVARMVKETKCKTFVAFNLDGEIIGWSQAEISSAASAVTGKLVGVIRIYVPSERKERRIITRSLLHRSHWWLITQKAKVVRFEILANMLDMEDLYKSMFLEEDPEIKTLRQNAD